MDTSRFYVAGYASNGTPLLAAAPNDGGAASPLYTFSAGFTDAGSAFVTPLTQDATWVYFVDSDQKTIVRVAK
jgi:hypothetical protein